MLVQKEPAKSNKIQGVSGVYIAVHAPPLVEIPPMALTDTAIRTAKPKDKPYKLGDEKGLFLLVHPQKDGKKCSKYWRFKYRYGGKEKLLALGVYPGNPPIFKTA